MNIQATSFGGITETQHAAIAHTNAMIASNAAIDKSKLNLTNAIVNADINSAAAVAQSKLNIDVAPSIHASRHVSGGADEITSPLNIAAIPNRTVAPNTVIVEYDPAEYSAGTTYTKVVETKLWKCSGTIRVKFDLKVVGAFTAYGQIYRNGTPVGTERSTTSTTYVTFSEGITGWSHGDLIQLYLKCSGGTIQAYSTNFLVEYI